VNHALLWALEFLGCLLADPKGIAGLGLVTLGAALLADAICRPR